MMKKLATLDVVRWEGNCCKGRDDDDEHGDDVWIHKVFQDYVWEFDELAAAFAESRNCALVHKDGAMSWKMNGVGARWLWNSYFVRSSSILSARCKCGLRNQNFIVESYT
jgi:hypothetical protein